MYAIVEIAGHQYKVRQDQQIYVNRLAAEEGETVSFDKVLLTDDNGNVSVGAPVIEGIEVDAKIVSHLKADKVIVFKKKRRKGYRVKNGHRQMVSLIEITKIGKGGAKPAKKAAPKKEAPKKVEEKPAAVEAKATTKADDLTALTGVGPKKADALNAIGVTSLTQIASWSADEITKYAAEASAKEEVVAAWVEQAKELTK